MNDNSKIDDFFRRAYENHEVTPPDFIWDQIEEKLKEKKKRRVIPIWWWTSGVAALFVIGLFFFNSNYKIVPKESLNVPIVVDANKTSPVKQPKETFSVQESVTDVQNQKTTKTKDKQVVSTPSSSNDFTNDLAGTDGDNTQKRKDNRNDVTLQSSSTQKKQKRVNNHITSSSEENVLQKSSIESVVTQNKSESSTNATSKLVLPNDTEVALSTTLNNENLGKTETNSVIPLQKNNSINNTVLVENTTPKTFIDSTKNVAVTQKNELEELLEKNEKEVTKAEEKNRWQITPNLAPIYFGSFDDGSPLDSNLDDNTKSYNTSLSYGVLASYEINDKLKIRAGINNVSVDYNTSDIVFFQTSNARLMRNIDPTVEGSVIEIIPIKNLNTTSFNRMESEQNTGILNQKMGYFEIPVELSYKLFDKKFGVEVVGGLSSLILNRNEVFLQNDDMTMKLGEATNLNSFHISTNLGVGFSYRFFKQFQANIEPIFKYQINTFSRDSQNFKPYIFGIYSGISFRF